MVELEAGLKIENEAAGCVNVDRLAAGVREVLSVATKAAQAKGWQLYLVGGGVRDLLRLDGDDIGLTDLDLVVDGVGVGETLMGIVRDTLTANPNNSVIGFNDNSRQTPHIENPKTLKP